MTELLQILLGISATIMATRELFYVPRKARQEILDRLPELPANGLTREGDDQSFEERVDTIVNGGLDVVQLQARFALPDRHLWKAIQHLYERNKIDVFLLKGETTAGGPPGVPGGTRAVLPIIVRGALPPDMRPERSEVETLLSRLRKRG